MCYENRTTPKATDREEGGRRAPLILLQRKLAYNGPESGSSIAPLPPLACGCVRDEALTAGSTASRCAHSGRRGSHGALAASFAPREAGHCPGLREPVLP